MCVAKFATARIIIRQNDVPCRHAVTESEIHLGHSSRLSADLEFKCISDTSKLVLHRKVNTLANVWFNISDDISDDISDELLPPFCFQFKFDVKVKFT
jgi:hypothetical protein